jgi:transposase
LRLVIDGSRRVEEALRAVLSREEDVEAHALRKQGWSISRIAAHLGRDRKTIRAYLAGERTPGERARAAPDVFEPFADYCRIRLADDPHLWASALFDEVVALGYPLAYPSFTRALRERALRPHCEPCAASRGRDVAVIEHPPGAETQWDWLELPNPPKPWGFPGHAHLLVGALSHSGKWRAALAEAEDQPHLAEALHAVSARLGGVSRRWRFDRMTTVCHPESGKLTASFSAIAKHYGVGIDICPPRHGNRKGVVEKGNHSLAQRWWRTLGDDTSIEAAQAGLDGFCARVGDGRKRKRGGQVTTIGALAETEPLRPLPQAAYPAVIEVARVVSAQALVAFRGNFYSIGPGLRGSSVLVRHRLGANSIDIVTASGITLARHRREVDGAGVLARLDEHVSALETAVLQGFSDARPCSRKQRRPPSAAALAAAEALRGRPVSTAGERVVVDFAAYIAAANAAASSVKSLPGKENQ